MSLQFQRSLSSPDRPCFGGKVPLSSLSDFQFFIFLLSIARDVAVLTVLKALRLASFLLKSPPLELVRLSIFVFFF